jgi:hypothetical protein
MAIQSRERPRRKVSRPRRWRTETSGAVDVLLAVAPVTMTGDDVGEVGGAVDEDEATGVEEDDIENGWVFVSCGGERHRVRVVYPPPTAPSRRFAGLASARPQVALAPPLLLARTSHHNRCSTLAYSARRAWRGFSADPRNVCAECECKSDV